MATTLVIGILTSFVAITVAAGLRRAPVRAQCPRCDGDTQSVQLPPAIRKAVPELRIRWCPACSWEGVGREGPPVIPGRPASHVSGFRWGRVRLAQDFGFRFAPPPVTQAEAAGEPPAHPSGFRFAADEDQAPPRRSHPSGFRWSESDAPAPDAPPAPLAFRWAEPRPPAGFRWGEPRSREAPPQRRRA